MSQTNSSTSHSKRLPSGQLHYLYKPPQRQCPKRPNLTVRNTLLPRSTGHAYDRANRGAPARVATIDSLSPAARCPHNQRAFTMSAEPAVTEGAPTAPAPTESAQAPPDAGKQTPSDGQKETSAKAPALSGAELKKLKKAEKEAKRAQQKAGGSLPSSETGPKEPKHQQKDAKQTPKDPKAAPKDAGKTKRRPSISLPPPGKKEPKKVVDTKHVSLFSHLYSQPKQSSMAGAAKEVHPAVQALGLQYSSYVICGSTARLVSMLQVFKIVIESYTTPEGQALARHLTAHYLSPQITYLQGCRPNSISMGNAIRYLKDLIVKIDPSVTEADAKEHLKDSIDSYIQERITAADELISSNAMQKIQPGDVVLTYASSTIVRSTLVKAHNAGVPFRVIVVDAKPLYEGKTLGKPRVLISIKELYH